MGERGVARGVSGWGMWRGGVERVKRVSRWGGLRGVRGEGGVSG